MREEIIEEIKKAIGVGDVHLEVPEIADHGDYSTNVAMVAFKKDQLSDSNFQASNPKELAEKIAEELRKDKGLMELAEKIEVAGPGFINFYLSKKSLIENIGKIYNDAERYGLNDKNKDKKVVVEYTDPNPFKEFHIGHLISNVTGEALSLLQEACGANVWRADYFGDVGAHAAKSVWGIRKKMQEEKVSLETLSGKSLKERIKFMGEGYVLGSKAFKEDIKAEEQINKLNTILYLAAQQMWKEKGTKPQIDYDPENKISEKELTEAYDLYVKARSWSLEYFETIYKRLGTKFDGYYPESLVGEIGYKYVLDNVGKIFEKSEGAIVFKGEKYGLHTRVFVNKHNLPTYEAKELGLAPAKYKDFKYDKSIIVVGKEIKEYFMVLVEALKQVNPKLGNVTEPICTGMVTVPGGEMSSRYGNVVTVTSLLDRLKEEIIKRMDKQDYDNSEKEKISEIVAVGALKYAFLKNSIGKDFVFSFDEALSLEGNSGPYLQYTYARTQSVLRKSQDTNSKSQTNPISQATSIEVNEEELALLRSFVHFPEVVQTAAENYAPNLLCNYLFDLAQRYNSFYNKHDILEKRTKNRNESEFRLAITVATGQILQNGLNMLGIKAPDKM